MRGAVARSWVRMSYRRRVVVLLAGSAAWLVLLFVLYGRGWLWGWLLPAAFLPLTTVLGLVGRENRARREARRTEPPVEVPPPRAPAPSLGIPLVAFQAAVVTEVTRGWATQGVPTAFGVVFAGIVWLELVAFGRSAGARRPWNVHPALYAAAALLSLGLGRLLVLVPDATNLAAMGAFFGPMLTWLLVWVVRRHRVRAHSRRSGDVQAGMRH